MSSDPLWSRPAPGSRRPRYTREQIAATALKLADEEGIEAVSMRRVAAELGAGTMTLYHYVATKNELLQLMDDALMAELLVADEEIRHGWREALTQIAHRSRQTLRRHPWVIATLGQARVGPNMMRHVEQSFAAVADLGLEPFEQLEVISLVDDYVLGFVMGGDFTPPVAEEWAPAVSDDVEAQLETGEFPRLRELVGDSTPHELMQRIAAHRSPDERFERGLAVVLDGIALRVTKGSF